MTGELADDPSSCQTASRCYSESADYYRDDMSTDTDSLSDHGSSGEAPHLLQLYARLQQRLRFAAYKVKLGLGDHPFDAVQNIVKDEKDRKLIDAVTAATNFVNNPTRRSPLRTRTEPAPCFDMDDLKFEDGGGDGYGQEKDLELLDAERGETEGQVGSIGGMVGAWSPLDPAFMDADEMDEPNLLSQPLTAPPETYYTSSSYTESINDPYHEYQIPFSDFSSSPSSQPGSPHSYRTGGTDRTSDRAYTETDEVSSKRKTNLDSSSISYPFDSRIPSFTKSHTAPTGSQTPSYAKNKDPTSWLEILEQRRRYVTSSSSTSSSHKSSSSHRHSSNHEPSISTSRRNSWAGDQDPSQSRSSSQTISTFLESLNRLRRDTSAPLPTTSPTTLHQQHHHHHHLATSAPSYYPSNFFMPAFDVSSSFSSATTTAKLKSGRDSTDSASPCGGGMQNAGGAGSVVLPGNLRYVPAFASSLAVPSLQQVAASLGAQMGGQQRGQRDRGAVGLVLPVSGRDS